MKKPLNKHLFLASFAAGLAGLVWVAAGFIDSSPLALGMTALIAAFYLAGAAELRQFRQASASLEAALQSLAQAPADLSAWLARIHPSLHNAVRLRIEGERAALPGPAFTPYLVGLLVMLGMLGTFLGMVVTLKGAVFALEKTSDLQAMRSALAVPVKGLGLAFGTSVAGVIASAMLGLMASISRRERLQAGQVLDARIATTLRAHTLAHQREQGYKALQQQSEIWPQLLDRMQAMMTQMESMGQQLNQRLTGNQEEFHRQAQAAYSALAQAVGQSLKDNLLHSAQAAADSIKPVLEGTLERLAREAALLQQDSARRVQAQLEGLSSSLAERYGRLQEQQGERERSQQQAWVASLQDSAQALAAHWQEQSEQNLARQQSLAEGLFKSAQALAAEAQSSQAETLAQTRSVLGQAQTLLRERIASEAQWLDQHAARMEQMSSMLQGELAALRDAEAARGAAAVERLAELQAALASHLTTLGTALEEPITRLIAAASEAPRAAAEVIAQLRQEISRSVARDNEVLQERSRILATLNGLLDGMQQASQDQRGVIESLVTQAAQVLQAGNEAFARQVQSGADTLDSIAAQVSGSAVEVASLSEAFGAAVHSYGQANEILIANLQRIEAAIDRNQARSDEQLGYYLAQAREIIDLSMSSQKEFVEELRRVPTRPAEEAR